MKTTLDLPDELFRRVKAKAAMDGVSLKELVTDYIVSGLQAPSPSRRKPSRLPVIKRCGAQTVPNLNPRLQAKLEEEDDLAAIRRSFGR